MPDREKIIKALECCTVGNACVSECPYFIDFSMTDGKCITQSQADALALLKEQQNQIWEFQDQVEYLTDKLKEQETTDINDLRVFHCKKCGYGIEDIFIPDEHNYSLVPKFCPNCGRVVK